MSSAASEPVHGRDDLGALLRFGRVLLPAAVAVGLFGVLRLGRQFPAATSSPKLLLPFLLPVLALALEVGALVAFSASVVRLCSQSPLGPLQARARALLPLVLAAALVLGLAQALPRGTERPGALANDLIARARQSCEGTGTVPVPLLGLTVRCVPERIEGPMPGAAAIGLKMRSLAFSDDLRRVDITGLELSAKRSLTVNLRAERARIVGLAPWARSARLSPTVRFALLLAIPVALGALAVAVWRPTAMPARPGRRWQSVLHLGLAALPGACAGLVVIALDQEQARPLAYAAAALAALLALVALALLRARVGRNLSFFRSF